MTERPKITAERMRRLPSEIAGFNDLTIAVTALKHNCWKLLADHYIQLAADVAHEEMRRNNMACLSALTHITNLMLEAERILSESYDHPGADGEDN